MTEADGTHATVILDRDFAVLSVETHTGDAHGFRPHDGPGR